MPSRRRLLQSIALAALGTGGGCLFAGETGRSSGAAGGGTRDTPGTPPDETSSEPADTLTSSLEDTPTSSPEKTPRSPSEETPGELQDTAEPPTRVGDDRILWEGDLAYSASVAPVLVQDERLLVGDSNGTVASVATVDGSVEWRFDTRLPVQTTPVPADGTVVALVGRHTEDFVVHGIDAATGTGRWQFSPGAGRLALLGTTSTTDSGDAVFVATSDWEHQPSGETLYALSLADGTTLWSHEVGDTSGGLVTGDRVYVPANDTVTALGTDGSRHWTYQGSEPLSHALATTGETVAVVMSPERRRPVVHGIDAATGERRWTFDDWRAFSLRTTGEGLFVGGEKLARLDPATGTPQWERDLEVARLVPGGGDNRWIDDWRQALSGAPVVDDTLYVGGTRAAAVGTDDGTVRWETDHEMAMARPAGLGGDHLVFHASKSTDDRARHLFAIDPATGDQQWEFAGRFRLTAPAVGTERVYAAESRSGLLALEL